MNQEILSPISEKDAALAHAVQLGYADAYLDGNDIVFAGGVRVYFTNVGSYRSAKLVAKEIKAAAKFQAAQEKFQNGQFVVEALGSGSATAKAMLGGKKPYLCELLPNGQRRWADAQKHGAAGHPKFLLDAKVGAVIECRIGWHGEDGTQAGTYWMVVRADGTLAGLTRDEAHRLAQGALIAPETAGDEIMVTSAYRAVPSCFFITARKGV